MVKSPLHENINVSLPVTKSPLHESLFIATSSEKNGKNCVSVPVPETQFFDYEFRHGHKINKKGPSLLYNTVEKQFYVRNRSLRNGDVAYVCYDSNCTVRVYIRPDGVCYRSNCNGHLHSDKEELAKTFLFKNACKEDCTKTASYTRLNNQTAGIQQIFNEQQKL